MPCNINQYSGLIAIANPDGKKSIADLLVELAGKLGESNPQHSAINALISTKEAGLVSMTLVLSSLRVTGVCLEIGGSEYRGDEAAEKLRENSSIVPMWGLMEAFELTTDQYNGFFSVYGDASLRRPRHLYWLAGYEEEQEEEGPGEEEKPMEVEDARKASSGETRLAMTSLESPDLFMAKVVLFSKIIRYTRTRDPVDLHKEARELSLQDPDSLYRLLIYLKTDETINTFYMKGRPCLMIKFKDDIAKSQVVSGDVIEIFASIDKNLIDYVSLQKVECPECAEIVRESCMKAPAREEPTQVGPQQPRERPRREEERAEEKEAEKEKARPRRRFFWFRR